jgi:hypothetical protein
MLGFSDSVEEPGSIFIRELNPNLNAVRVMLNQALGFDRC